MNNNIPAMPTQHPWARVGMGMGTQCMALIGIEDPIRMVHHVNSPCSRQGQVSPQC